MRDYQPLSTFLARAALNTIRPDPKTADFLTSAGIAENTLATFETGWLVPPFTDTKRLIIPVRNVKGNIEGLAAYSRSAKHPWQYLPGFRPDKQLFNLHRVVESRFRYTVLVTSALDCMKVSRLGYNVVATLEPGLSTTQSDLLRDNTIGILALISEADLSTPGTEDNLDRLNCEMHVRRRILLKQLCPLDLSLYELYELIEGLIFDWAFAGRH